MDLFNIDNLGYRSYNIIITLYFLKSVAVPLQIHNFFLYTITKQLGIYGFLFKYYLIVN